MTLVRNGRRGNLIKDEKTNVWSIVNRSTNRIVTSGTEDIIKKLFLRYENYQLNVAK